MERDVDALRKILPPPRTQVVWTQPAAKDWSRRALDLAANPIDSMRDGTRSAIFASEACRLTEYKDPSCLGALAAAYAESGDFESAKKWQKQAIDQAPAPDKSQYETRLRLYESEQPYRETR